MKEPGAGPETGAPEWSRPQRASEPLPPPPSGYKFAGPDYLYAPRQEEEEAPAAAPPAEAATTTSAPAFALAPAMVWSEARSTWEPAAPPVALPPTRPTPFPVPLRPNWSRPKPRRRVKGFWWVITIVVGFAVVNCFVSGLRGALFNADGPTTGLPLPDFSAAPAPVLTTEPSTEPTTRPTTEPPVSAPPAVLTTLADVLGAQVAGVRAGNESWFLRAVDPNAKATLDTYKRMFANVRALQAANFTENSEAGGGLIKTRTYFRVTVAFCIGGTTTPCALSSAVLDVQVGPLGKGVAIEGVAPVADFTRVAPPPWLATPLTVATGGNVLVATTPATKSDLASVLAVAEVAAARADQYAAAGRPPRPYVVYVANPTDVAAWFGDTGRISYGVVDPPVGADQIVLALPDATTTGPKGGDGLAADLQRALAYMALTEDDSTPLPDDDFSAGLLEYAAYDGLKPPVDADTLAPVATYVHSGGWNNSCYYKYEDATPFGVTAMPGVGLLAFRYLAETFDFYYAFSFWNAVERLDETLDNASLELLQQMPWSDVDSACAQYLTDKAGP